MYANKQSNATEEQFTWIWLEDGYFSLLCSNNRYASMGSNGQLYCNRNTAEEDAQLYYSVEMRGVWAAGVIQFPEDPEYKDGHRMYKIRG
jgi:hypothetical protein